MTLTISLSNIFEFDCYKKALRHWIDCNQAHRGLQRKMARAAKCHPTFLSQVLNGKTHLTMEHGFHLARWLRLFGLAEDYFLGLLAIARCSDSEYRKVLQKKNLQIQTEVNQVSQRLDKKTDFSEADQLKYYSSWEYTALHMLVGLEKFRCASEFADRLRITPIRAQQVLEDLQAMNLVAYLPGKNLWISLNRDVFVSKDSPYYNLHHRNLRQQTLGRDLTLNESLHYSACFSADAATMQKMKELLLDCIVKNRENVGSSEAEELYILAIDLFQA